jgi:hypothetical protein
MSSKFLASAFFLAVLTLPPAAHAQDGAGPASWGNAGGTDPARDLVGLGTRIFDRGHAYTAGLSSYSSQARYEPQTIVGMKPKRK